ncbi:MAG TPA: hypothetical protein PKE31_11775 [Pseudomonadota bacterium]|nr:hypothetical protein [Pseudomonadota bacterium]
MTTHQGTKSFLPDPFVWVRKVYDTVEQLAGPALEKLISTERFARLNGKIMEVMLKIQRGNRETAQKVMELSNYPTREDITRMGELILQLEEKIDALAEQVATQRKENHGHDDVA